MNDFQVSRVQVVNGLAQTVVDNGTVGTTGFEANGVFPLGAGFTAKASVVYSPAKFLEAFPVGATTPIAYKNMPLPRAPRWTGQLGISYVGAVSSRLQLKVDGSVDYSGDTDLQFRSTDPLSPIARKHALLDGKIALRDAKGGWEIAVIGSNITDRRYVNFATALSVSGGAYYGTLNRPRIVAFQLSIFR